MELGEAIGAQLGGGEILAIVGPLGAGKTHLIKGIATGLGATDRQGVNSPTFVIINQYMGHFDIFHIDAYRIESVAEFDMLGFDDLCYPESVVMIEWADKVEQAIARMNPIRIELQHTGQRRRSIALTSLPGHVKLP
jgi:tRNA threonylcarbamoyladenosine biosynthesis protein TsaE